MVLPESQENLQRERGLEGITPHNEQFHWAMQRFRRMVVVLTIFILAGALAGLFGAGPISSARDVGPDSTLRIEYLRFARLSAPMDLVFHVQPAQGSNMIDVRIDRQYLNRFDVERVTPTPITARSEAGYLIYVFESTGPAAITFSLVPRQFGRIQGQVQTSDGKPMIVRHLVYP